MRVANEWGHFGDDPWGLKVQGDRAFRRSLVLVLMLGAALVYWSQHLPRPVQKPVLVPVLPPVSLSLVLPEPQSLVRQGFTAPKPRPASPPAPSVRQVKRHEAPPAKQAAASVRQEAASVQQADALPAKIEDPRQSNRDRARSAGLLALQSELTSLQAAAMPAVGEVASSSVAPSALQAEHAESQATAQGRYRGASSLADGDALVKKGDGNGLGAHQRRELSAGGSVAAGVAAADRTAAAVPKGRSLEELQMAFEGQKLGFYTLFRRAARSSGLESGGSVVVSLTVSPGGRVTDCRVVSSSFRDSGLLEKVLVKVKGLRFESKDVPEFTYPAYPITFIPS